MSALRTVAACIGLAVASSVVTTGAYVGWAVVHDALDHGAKKRVPFSDILDDCARGGVDDIHYKNRVYTFHTARGTFVTLGPSADASAIAALQSPPPHVVIE